MIIDDMERDGFVFYRSFYEAVQDIEDEHTRLLALEAIINYGVLGEELPLPKGMASIVFKLVKPQLEANNERYLNGLKGGAPTGNQNARKQPKQPMVDFEKQLKQPMVDLEEQPKQPTVVFENNQKQPKEKDKEKDKDKDINKLSGKPDDVAEIIDYLNEVCGTHYKPNTPETVRLIRARLKEGFSVEDFNRVIDTMYAKWGSNGDMARYLRPQTLFGTKFESYLNMAAVQTTAQSTPSAPINKLGFENYTPDPSIKNDLYARAIEMLEAAEKG